MRARADTYTPGRYIVEGRTRTGLTVYVCYGEVSRDKADAIRFTNREAAHRACIAERWGDPNAFWNCERETARRIAKRRTGWTFRVIEETDQ